MIPRVTVTTDRLYLHWSEPGGPFHTVGFPIEAGHVVFADEAELIDMAEHLGVDLDDWPCVAHGSWEPRCLAIEAIPQEQYRMVEA